jgi:hypothetical protein
MLQTVSVEFCELDAGAVLDCQRSLCFAQTARRKLNNDPAFCIGCQDVAADACAARIQSEIAGCGDTADGQLHSSSRILENDVPLRKPPRRYAHVRLRETYQSRRKHRSFNRQGCTPCLKEREHYHCREPQWMSEWLSARRRLLRDAIDADAKTNDCITTHPHIPPQPVGMNLDSFNAGTSKSGALIDASHTSRMVN